MTTPPCLLVLTDFTPAANRALAYAISLAVPLGARIVLLHVRRDSLLDPDAFSGHLGLQSEEAVQLALNRLTDELPVPVVTEVAHGRLLPAVAEAVSRHRPLLLVMGLPERDELPDELNWTTALELLHSVPFPLLVVPATVARLASPRQLLLAADGEAFSLGGFAGPAHRLLQALQAELTVLHCTSAPAEETAGPALSAVLHAGLAQGLAEPRSRQVVADGPAEGILAAARPANCDAVVLLARQRSLLGQLFHRSVTARVLLHCTVPALVLPVE